jgi:hypothetical protein
MAEETTNESKIARDQNERVDRIEGTLFPYEKATEHWDIDFNDTHQSYEGSDLPLWILAGWAMFILWAVIYLVAGLPTAF